MNLFIIQKHTINLLILFFLLPVAGAAQVLSGHVYTVDEKGKKETLPGANVFLSQTKKGVMTDPDGAFKLSNDSGKEQYLVASFIGYSSDSILVSVAKTGPVEFILTEGVELAEAVVTAHRQGTVLSRLTAQKTELITKTGLMKMACCNLSESFENSATVTVGFTDAVSGAKQVQLLGLSGIYTQMMDENIPTLRGLASTYGWSYTPGSWLESIQISKGASSVINGYESVSGQINLEHKKPNHTEPLFINLYIDDTGKNFMDEGPGRYEANVTTATQVTDKLWTGLLLHGSLDSKSHDENGDGFLDMPKSKQANLYNRWFYLNPEKGLESRTGFKFLYETREGGQHGTALPGTQLYETDIMNKSFTVYNKTGFSVGEKEGQSIGIINNFTYYEQDSEFGKKQFDGTQQSFYSNILFSSHIGSPSHQYTTGLSFAYDNYRTGYRDALPFNETPYTPLNREEVVPGAFAQYTYSFLDKFTFILGMRGDYNSEYGWLFTPRTNLKYSFTEDLIFRASAGRGYRSPNVIAENIGLMASSRKFHVEELNRLDMEKAWNYGANLTVYIPIWDERKATLSLDYFHTDFRNQAVVDMERDPESVYFYNLEGRSYADAWQADLSFTPVKGLDVFAAFRYNNTKVTYSEGEKEFRLEKPLTSRYRGLLNVSYATNFRKWVFDVTAQINGPSRLPSMNGYSTVKEESPVFPVYFAQITKNTKRFDIYVGAENIFNFKQRNPIVQSDRPFDKGFDSSMIWGPLMGSKIYAGIRWRIGELL